MRHTEPLDEPATGEFGERACRLHTGDGIAAIDVRHAGSHLDAFGVGEQVPGGHVDLTPEHVGDPHRGVPQCLDATHVRKQVGRTHRVGRNHYS